jgi:hypothetical protein
MGVQTHSSGAGLNATVSAGGAFALLALAVMLCVLAWLNPPSIALLQPDSAGYLSGSPIRGVAYPAFLSWIGDLETAVRVQLVFYFAALAAVSLAVSALVGRSWVGLLCLVFAGANPALTKYCFTILTEALTMAATMSAAAAVLAGLKTRRLAWFVLASIFVAVAIDLRPTSWAFLVPVVLAALVSMRGLGQRAAAAAIVAVLPLALQAVLFAPASGDVRREFLALNMFGKLALIAAPDGTPLNDAIATRVAGMRAEIAAQPDFSRSWIVRTAYAEHLRYGVWRDFSDRHFPPGEARLAAVLRIAADNPAAYAKETARQILAFWLLPDAMTAREAAAAQGAFASLPELESPPQPQSLPFAVVAALRGVSFGALGVSILALLAYAAAKNRSPALAGAAYFALSIHGYALLLALLHSALPRYVLAAWPLMGAMGLLALAALSETGRISKWRRRRGTRL